MKKASRILLATALLFTSLPSFAQWLSATTTSAYHHYAVNAVTETVIYAGGYGGSFLKSSDGGSTWNSVGIGSPDWITDIHFEDELNGWVVASPSNLDPGDILKTNDGGKSWTSMHSQYQYTSMYWSSSSVAYSGTRDGHMVKTNDGGKSWTLVNIPSTSNLHKIFFLDDSYGFAIDTDYKLYRTSDGGASWDVFSHIGIKAVYFHDKTNGYCVNEKGEIGHSTDGGATFTYWASPFPEYKLHDIAFSDALNGIAIGGLDCRNGNCTPKPAILVTRDGGLTWTNDTQHSHLGQEIGFYAVDFSPKGTPFIAGSDHIMLRNAKFTSVFSVNNKDNSSLSFYPNPISSSLNIVAEKNTAIGQEFMLLNSLGQVLKTWTMDNVTTTIDMKDVASGMYILINRTTGVSYKVLKD